MRKPTLIIAIAIPLICFLLIILYNLPPIHDRLGWRLEALRADIKYALSPPEQVVFTPQMAGTMVGTDAVLGTPAPPELPTPTATISLVTSEPTQAPTITLTPTQSSTPLPGEAMLTGIRHEYQRWNNCGPANLAMALSYWGWSGNQRDTAAFLKPNERDKNVMPYEMEAYVEGETDLDAVVRVGGDLQTIKSFVSAGFPVVVEKGFEGVNFDGWMGHYQVVNGYSDSAQVLYVQDSYKGPNMQIPYQEMESNWRAFNYTYLVIYPLDHREQVLNLLGLQTYENFNNHHAAQKAMEDAAALTGRDLYFALVNQGANQVRLQDYAAAATVFDAAFANYPLIPEPERPWRMMWYQTGPYFAYYFTGRYQDVINLATTTLETMSEPILEESYYWRARAKMALGQYESAIEDLHLCIEAHPGFNPCEEQLRQLGVEP